MTKRNDQASAKLSEFQEEIRKQAAELLVNAELGTILGLRCFIDFEDGTTGALLVDENGLRSIIPKMSSDLALITENYFSDDEDGSDSGSTAQGNFAGTA